MKRDYLLNETKSCLLQCFTIVLWQGGEAVLWGIPFRCGLGRESPVPQSVGCETVWDRKTCGILLQRNNVVNVIVLGLCVSVEVEFLFCFGTAS